jgi:hypothetical protein
LIFNAYMGKKEGAPVDSNARPADSRLQLPRTPHRPAHAADRRYLGIVAGFPAVSPFLSNIYEKVTISHKII